MLRTHISERFIMFLTMYGASGTELNLKFGGRTTGITGGRMMKGWNGGSKTIRRYRPQKLVQPQPSHPLVRNQCSMKW
jgi:hypothetical protein